jgi:hypothetical protein
MQECINDEGERCKRDERREGSRVMVKAERER